MAEHRLTRPVELGDVFVDVNGRRWTIGADIINTCLTLTPGDGLGLCAGGPLPPEDNL